MSWLNSIKQSELKLPMRPRRNRKSAAIRELVKETRLHPANLVWPLFVQEGSQKRSPISSLPGCARLSADLIIEEVREAHKLGIQAIALFPVIEDSLKDSQASESKNENGLLPQTIKALKDSVPEIAVITDVAMDPYSSDGHDGIVEHGKILNDTTLEILADMALVQANAGADMVAPSDMMDGRVGFIRKALDESGFQDVGILSYAAKYASALYGPFRDALDSAPKSGAKKTYQMDPANIRDAIRAVALDIQEGADIVMIKPALPYLDVIRSVKDKVNVPVAAYHVSGEYAMAKAAGEKGWLVAEDVLSEMLLCIKRAGADIIFTYAAKDYTKYIA